MVINPLSFLFDFLINMINLSTSVYNWLMSDLLIPIFGSTTYFELLLGVGLTSVIGFLIVKALL
jgi:hypothetical protein